MLYLDSNVFIHPALYNDAKAVAAASILKRIKEGAEPALTAALTIDEVAYVIQKHASRQAALRVARAVLAFPGLTITPTTVDDVRAALDLMDQAPHPQARDAIHAATALRHGATIVVSDDDIFAKIPGLEHRPLKT